MKKIVYNWEILALTRFFLAMVVLLQHIPGTLIDSSETPIYTKIGAFEAVLGFLLISGLSIGKSIQKNQDSYFKRRLQRIYPTYIVSIVIHYLVMQDEIDTDFIVTLFFNLVFLNNIFTTLSYIVVAWSLSLEVWLYALAPYLYKLSYKVQMSIVYISFAAFIFYIVGRTLFHWPYYAGLSGGLNLFVLGFIWVIGFIYSLHPEKYKFIRLNVAAFFLMYIGLTVLIQVSSMLKHNTLSTFVDNNLTEYILNTVTLLIVYIVVFYNHYITKLSINTKRVLDTLGNISYPLYLTHRSVFILLKRYNINNIILSIGIALVVSYLVYVIFDFYTKKRVPAAA